MKNSIRNLICGLSLLFISACASIEVDTAATDFDEDKYAQDLSDCRGGNFAESSVKSVGYGIYGGLAGAAHGLIQGAIRGNTAESVLLWASFGAVIGLGAGAYESFDENNQELRNCMITKGYNVF